VVGPGHEGYGLPGPGQGDGEAGGLDLPEVIAERHWSSLRLTLDETISYSNFSGLRERSGCCRSVEFDADDGVQLDRVRRNPVLAVGKIEKTESSHGHRF
jgi:hypothetical protein